MMFTQMGVRLEHVSEFRYLGCVLDEAGTNGAECSRVFPETLLVHVLTYGSEIMLWKEKERPRVRAVQMDNLIGFLVITRMDSDPNARIRELCGR